MSGSELHDKIQRAMLRDRHRLRSLLKPARRGKGGRQPQPAEQRLAEFHQRLEQSISVADMRAAKRPTPNFDLDLPILARRDEIVQTIRDNQVVVICGETGSGKSTQLPKLCLDAGFGTFGMIGHTQPRRIAARTIANRLAEELSTTVGEAVGFKIRFTDKTKPDTFIKLMTDGILLAETQGDRFLEQYEVLIIDEAHERSLNSDFLLGFIHQLLP
ncbi:MAG: AAA family ATPase [Planctomycetota bacterium]